MSVLSQYIERPVEDGGAGIATVQISLIWPVTEKIRPPRALWVPFPFGRPLGPPNRPDVQLDVLRQTLGLVNQLTAPALVDYPDDVEDDFTLEEVWSCPVTFPDIEPKNELESLNAQMRTEAQLLMPWFDEGLRARGRTTFGTSGRDANSIPEMLGILAEFALDARMTVPEGYAHPMPQLLRYIAADVRAFYTEAAISKPGAGFPSPEELEEWFFLHTVAGDVFYQVRDRLVSVDMLALIAHGLDDDEVDRRLVLISGTTAGMALDIVRDRGPNRELLKVSASGSTGFPTGRFSRTIVPTTMQDRRRERTISTSAR